MASVSFVASAQEPVMDETVVVNATGPAELSNAPSGEYQADVFHKYLMFSYDHRGWSSPHILWRDFDVRIFHDAEDPSQNTVEVVIMADSVDTGTAIFDGHMRNYFEAEEYPEIVFRSTAYVSTGPDSGRVEGELTIRGITQPFTLDVSINHAGMNDDPIYGVPAIGITATGSLLRADYDILQQFSWVAPAMHIHAEVELIKSSEFDEVVERATNLFGPIE